MTETIENYTEPMKELTNKISYTNEYLLRDLKQFARQIDELHQDFLYILKCVQTGELEDYKEILEEIKK